MNMEVILRDGVKNDETFLSLLSSQRELLNQLNVEAAAMRDQLARSTDSIPSNQPVSDLSSSGRRMLLDQKNHPKNRRSSLDLLYGYSKRLSIEFGIPVLSSHGDSDPYEDYYGYDKTTGNNTKSDVINLNDLGESRHITKKKRRLSSLGFLSATNFFEDHLRSSRHSIVDLSLRKGHGNVKVVVVNGDGESDSEDEFAEDVVGPDCEAKEKKHEEGTQQVTIPVLLVDPEKAREVMETFTKAMEKSQKSQQDIHSWDRQMGLKRSHSKTMRLSTRSRKKLRATLKKDFGSILPDIN
jgi:hypothetical protein